VRLGGGEPRQRTAGSETDDDSGLLGNFAVGE
jgi:hypothetical protein